MYIPPAFAETDVSRLHDFIERHSFGLLVSQGKEAPFASHLPFLLERGTGTQGRLVGHMARANPQWREARNQQVLVVFSGPHAYISPTWYEAEKVVPTWNYVAVHAYGRLCTIEDSAEAMGIVRKTVETYEAAMPRPWSLAGPENFVEDLVRQIVGFRIDIDRLEGKWKLNQNQPRERRDRVAAALRGAPGDDARAIATLMAVPGEVRDAESV